MYARPKVLTGRPSMLRLVKGEAEIRAGGRYGRKLLMQTLGHLKEERASWDSHYRELGRFQLPRVPRFFSSDRNKGVKRHRELYNDCATRAIRVGSAALIGGVMPQSKQWFEITTADESLARNHEAKLWLRDSARRMGTIFERANTYLSSHALFESMLAFGIGCNVVLPDRDTTIWHYPSPIGEFYVATDYKGRIVTLYRVYQMTVREIVDQFGPENVSVEVRRLMKDQSLEAGVEVCHAIERRTDRNPEMIDNLNMPWRSCWFETKCDEHHDKVLLESGFRRFPGIVPRWWVDGNDSYGSCPGMDALGRIKGLQLREVEQARAFEYGVRPPLLAPTTLKSRGVNLLPHGVTYADVFGGGNAAIKALYDIDPRLIPHMRADMDRVEEAINEAYYKNVFLMLSMASSTTQRTAEEVIERRDEKFVVIGPAYARTQREMLAPLVELTFWEAYEQGRLLPLPQVLEGKELSIKFVSILALALQRIGYADQDQFIVRLGTVGKLWPEALDRFDADGWVDSQGSTVDPRIIVPLDQAKKLRMARNQRDAAVAQSALIEQQAGAAKQLASAQTTQPSVLTQLASSQ